MRCEIFFKMTFLVTAIPVLLATDERKSQEPDPKRRRPSPGAAVHTPARPMEWREGGFSHPDEAPVPTPADSAASSDEASMSVEFTRDTIKNHPALIARIMQFGFTYDDALALAGQFDKLGDSDDKTVANAIRKYLPGFTRGDVIVSGATTSEQVNGAYNLEVQHGENVYVHVTKPAIQLKVVRTVVQRREKRCWTVFEGEKELYRNEQNASATPPATGWTCVSAETLGVLGMAPRNAQGTDRIYALLGNLGAFDTLLNEKKEDDEAMVVTTTACEDDPSRTPPAAVEAPAVEAPAPPQNVLGGLLAGFMG